LIDYKGSLLNIFQGGRMQEFITRINFIIIFCAGGLLAQENWMWQSSKPQGNVLYNVEILNKNTIVAAGGSGTVIRSIDGGESWQADYFLMENNSSEFENVHFLDQNIAWAVGDGDRVYKTTDGGLSWDLYETDLFLSFEAVYFADQDHGWIAGNGSSVTRTDDSGQSWNSYATGTNNILHSLNFIAAPLREKTINSFH
jgi:photosystem II stability/assembly factor-like uncharacterized protein